MISIVLVTYLLSQIEIGDLIDTLANVHWPSVGLFVLVSLAGLLARSWRYWLLIGGEVGLWPLALVTLVRNLFVDLLPARLGSLSYVYAVSARCGLPLDRALASFFLAFVFDAVAMAPLLLLALLVVGGALPVGATALALSAAALLALSLLALYLMAPALRVAGKVLGMGAAGWRQRAARGFVDTAAEVERTWRRGALLPVFAVSLLVRVLKFGAYYCLLHAVLVSHGYDWGSLSFFRVFLGVAGAELSATLPIHSLAGFGTYEAAWALGFTQLGFPSELAILSGFATHLISQIHDYGLGLVAFLWIMRPGFRASGQA